MPDWKHFNRETADQRRAQRQRTEALISGARGADGLTDAERALIAKCRAQGLDICGGWLENENGRYWHGRTVVRDRLRT